jgi:folate-dependent phosphoribosylglycinamide formyltransferase PurN
MRIAILSSLPWLDMHSYKNFFLDELVKKPWAQRSDIVLVYGRTKLSDYLQQARRFGIADGLMKLRSLTGARSPRPAVSQNRKGKRLPLLAAELGIATHFFERLGDPECLSFLKAFRPDVMSNLSGQYIPSRVLAIPRSGVFSAHYSFLPELRGGDTVRWSIFLDRPLFVCHMALAPEMDMGDILRTKRVPVARGDRLEDIYCRCQMASAEGHLRLLDDLKAGRITRIPQRKEQGSLFYMMGRYLKSKVDHVLWENRYSHYVEADSGIV